MSLRRAWKAPDLRSGWEQVARTVRVGGSPLSRPTVRTYDGPGDPEETSSGAEPDTFDTSVAHISRVYNFWLGGRDNYAADREAAEQVIAAYPTILPSVRAQPAFLGRAVRYLVGEAGIRQFPDIGTGRPSADNTHEVAQRAAPESRVVYPESRVVYVDNDPIVLAHARALLTSSPEGPVPGPRHRQLRWHGAQALAPDHRPDHLAAGVLRRVTPPFGAQRPDQQQAAPAVRLGLHQLRHRRLVASVPDLDHHAVLVRGQPHAHRRGARRPFAGETAAGQPRRCLHRVGHQFGDDQRSGLHQRAKVPLPQHKLGVQPGAGCGGRQRSQFQVGLIRPRDVLAVPLPGLLAGGGLAGIGPGPRQAGCALVRDGRAHHGGERHTFALRGQTCPGLVMLPVFVTFPAPESSNHAPEPAATTG